MGTINTTNYSVNEIVFENRNKAYGAYTIRKEYDNSVIKSFLLTMIGLLSLILIYRLIPPENHNQMVNTHVPVDTAISVTIDKPIDPKPQIRPNVQITKQKDPAMPQFVDSVETQKIDSVIPDPGLNHPGSVTGNNNSIPSDSIGGTGIAGTPPVDQNIIYGPGVQEMPRFPGGDTALLDYLGNHIQYTEMAIAARLNGTMYLKFVVGKEGEISGIEVLKKVGYGCEKQAIQVVQNMPRWTPGKMNHKPVPVYYTLPIRYTCR